MVWTILPTDLSGHSLASLRGLASVCTTSKAGLLCLKPLCSRFTLMLRVIVVLLHPVSSDPHTDIILRDTFTCLNFHFPHYEGDLICPGPEAAEPEYTVLPPPYSHAGMIFSSALFSSFYWVVHIFFPNTQIVKLCIQ